MLIDSKFCLLTWTRSGGTTGVSTDVCSFALTGGCSCRGRGVLCTRGLGYVGCFTICFLFLFRLQPTIQFVLLAPCSFFLAHCVDLLFGGRWLLCFRVCATAFSLMACPPGIRLPRCSVHTAFHDTKVWWPVFARPITLPHVSPVAVLGTGSGVNNLYAKAR